MLSLILFHLCKDFSLFHQDQGITHLTPMSLLSWVQGQPSERVPRCSCGTGKHAPWESSEAVTMLSSSLLWMFLSPPLLGKIPSSLLDVNYFQANDLYIFSLSLLTQFYSCYYLLFLCTFQLCQMLCLRQLPFRFFELFYVPLFQEYDWFLGLLGKLNQILFSWWKIQQHNKNSIFDLKKKKTKPKWKHHNN